MFGSKAEIGVTQLPERLDEEACGDEEGQGHADFADDEGVAPARVFFAGAGSGGSIAETFLHGQIGAVEAGADAEEDGGDAGEEDEDRAHAGIDVNLIAKGDGVGEVMTEDAQCGPGSGEARRAAEEADEEAFGEELADEPGFGGTESAADGEFAAAAVGAGQHESGEVGAGDEPDDGDGGVERVEAGANVVGGDVSQGLDAHRFRGFGGGIFVEKLLVDGGDFLLGLLDGDAGAEARDGRERGVAAVLEGAVIGQRGIDFVAGALRELEVRRHDSDDGVGLTVDSDGVADDGPARVKDLVPGGVAEDDDLGGAWLCVFGKETAAEDRLGAEDIEQVGAGADLGDEFNVVAIAEGGDLDGPPCEVGENVAAGFPVADVGQRSGIETASVERSAERSGPNVQRRGRGGGGGGPAR